MENFRLVSKEAEPTDEALLRRLAEGDEEALVPLHRRYSALILGIACQSLDRPVAEEVVQDVFIAVWRKAKTYDPDRGPVRPRLMRIVRTRVINELRNRGRRPSTVSDPEGLQLSAVPDGGPEPDLAVWRDYQRSAVRDAVDALPAPQRQALSLAFFDDLSHQQIATFLGVPLGTAKTRIRTGMRRMRVALVAFAAVSAVALVGGLVALGLRLRQEQARFDRHEQALRIVTSSDATALRLATVGGTDPATHGTYRSRPDEPLAVLTLSHFPAAPSGSVYRVWARSAGVWRSLGTVDFDAAGHALLIVDQRSAAGPEALEVTLDDRGWRRVAKLSCDRGVDERRVAAQCQRRCDDVRKPLRSAIDFVESSVKE